MVRTPAAASVVGEEPHGEDDPDGSPTRSTAESPAERSWVPFAAWGVGAYLVVTAVLVARSLARTDGTFVYLIDDPAIHLSIARTFADSGTWGIVPGEFQSASSAPLWTLSLSAVHLIAPFASDLAPLLLNVAGSIAVILLLARNQDVLRPSRERPIDGIVVAVISVVVLFLPALTLLGMEHIAHMAIVVGIVAAFGRASGRPGAWPGPTLVILLAVAGLVRFESAFIATGLAVATLVAPSPLAVWVRVQRAAVLLAATGIPTAAFCLLNRAMGQGWLPNSVLAKGQVISGSTRSSIAPLDVLNRLTTDPVVIGLVIVAVGVVIVGWDRWQVTGLALAFTLTTVLHVTFASVGWFDRYQAYLIAFGTAVLLRAGTEVGVADRLPPRGRVVLRPALLVASVLLLCSPKIDLTQHVPQAVAETYQQRYQAALFLERYYEGEPIATGELGYISLFHDGPITDLFGLGDYEVLQMRRQHDQGVPPELWAQLARDRGFQVVAVYPRTLWLNTPSEWILVGTWHLDHEVVTAFQDEFQFWATTPEAVAPLQEQLREFESELPSEVRVELNELATFRAEQMLGEGG